MDEMRAEAIFDFKGECAILESMFEFEAENGHPHPGLQRQKETLLVLLKDL